VSGEVMVRLTGVSRSYGPVKAVKDLELAVAKGEILALLGPSGCGKTTTLRLIAGFESPDSGSVEVGGRTVAGPGTDVPPERRRVGMVFQDYALFPHLSVEQNVAYGLPNGKNRQGRVDEVLALAHLEGLGDRMPHELSGGQQQRVALARALAPQPKVLLLDEPLSALDYKLRKEMQIELKRLQHETGITFIFVTHDQEEALTMSDRVAVMSAGKILQVGTPWDIYDKPAERFVADFIGETNFLTAAVDGIANGRAHVTLGSGAKISATMAEGFQPNGRATLVVRPEHAKLSKDPADLSGTVENIVYFGTDTHIHVRLDGGEPFIVRQQNTRSADCGFEQGEKVGIKIGDDAAQVLKD
jgi:spermidine/putrescine transport system ATP-binding protein